MNERRILKENIRDSRRLDRSKSTLSSERRAERRRKTRREHFLVDASRATSQDRIYSDVTLSSEKKSSLRSNSRATQQRY
jgi:hypothetical protein